MTSRVPLADVGTVLDAPIDVVWDYIMRDSEFHPQAHRGVLKNFKWEKLDDKTVMTSCDVFRAGRWMRLKARSTTVEPYVRFNEELTGPYAGTTFILLYRPRGNKTAVDVFGELVSETLSPGDLEREWMQILSETLDQDAPFLAKYVKSRRKGTRAGKKPKTSK